MLVFSAAGRPRPDGSIALDQHHTLRADRELLANRPHLLTRLRLEPHPVNVDPEDRGDAAADHGAVRKDFGALGEDHAIQIHNPPPRLGHPVAGDAEHPGRIPPPVGRISVGEELADVAEGCRPEEGIGNGVEENVGIAVAEGLPVVRDRDPTEHERRTRPEAVGVVAEADADHGGPSG